jgi:hypothetical protein
MQKKDAGVEEWMDWMAQPLKTILKQHKDLVYGPVDDLMDEVIRKIAPSIVKAVVAQEIEEDVEEFIDGAREGRFEALDGQLADPLRGQSEDYGAGYQWGFDNAQTWDGKRLPAGVESDVVRTQIQEFRGKVTEEVFISLMEKTWHALSPAHTLKAMIKAIKKHGWKLGIGFAIFEVVEHALLPAVMIKMTGNPEWAVLGTLPIGEIIYAIAMRVLGRTDKNLDELTEQGHLDWYEAKHGPVRLASQRRASCERVALRYVTGASHV